MFVNNSNDIINNNSSPLYFKNTHWTWTRTHGYRQRHGLVHTTTLEIGIVLATECSACQDALLQDEATLPLITDS